MAKSLKSNFIYNIINTVSGLLFPLITFPYASRVIMAEGIGQVQFFTSIINYIVLLTSIGIPMYGIREIARVRDDARELSKTATELISLNLMINVLGYIAVAIICWTSSKVQVNIPLFLLLSSSIVLTTLGCQWFYSGVEDFKYITIRGLVVKIICIVLLFTLVRTKENLLYYGAYTVLGYIGNYLLNFIRLRKYIHLSDIDWQKFNPWRHLKPAFAIFIFNIVTSIYLNLDTIMLGLFKTNENVGYYTAATKLSHMLVMVVTSLGAVMLPRLSNLIKNELYDDFHRLVKKSYEFILLISFPICFGIIVVAPSLIRLFSGESFIPAITTLRIIAPTIVAIAISNLIGMQVLYPLEKVKLVTISTCVGAAVNFGLNCLLIPLYAQDGAAIATVSAEFCVTITQIVFVWKLLPFNLLNKKLLFYLAISILMTLLCNSLSRHLISDVAIITIVPICGFIIYAISLLAIRDGLAMEMFATIKNKIK